MNNRTTIWGTIAGIAGIVSHQSNGIVSLVASIVGSIATAIFGYHAADAANKN